MRLILIEFHNRVLILILHFYTIYVYKLQGPEVRFSSDEPCSWHHVCVFADGPDRQLSLWITGCCCHKMAKGGKLEPWNWHILAHLL